jgi:RecG-like helicase
MSGIKSTWFGKKIPSIAKQALHDITDTYPADFYEKYDLMPLKDMLHTLHYPENIQDTTIAKKTLFFKRLLRVQLHSLIQKQLYQ